MSGATDAPVTPLPTAAPAGTPAPVGATPPTVATTPPTIAAPAPTVEAPPPTVAATPPTVAPASASPTAVSPPASPEEKCDQQCGAADGKCSKECSGGDGTCCQESCKCDASCKCKSKNGGPSKSGKPEDCQSSNPMDCSDGTCKLTRTEDPTNVGLVTNGKCLGPALYESPEEPHCKEGDKSQECQGKSEWEQKKGECHGKKECEEKKKADCEKRKESDRERCPLSGDCDGSKQDSSLVVWHPNQGSPGGSPRSQTAEQKGETHGPKAELKPCAHPEDIHKQEEHHKLCSPLPQGDKLKAILFDIDGTIADSDPIHFLAFQQILAEAGYNGGVPISHEFFIRQMSGKLNYVIAEELMPEMEEKKRIEMMDEKEALYRTLASKDLQPIPGFLKFSEYVKKRGLRRAAVTNSPRLNAEQVIAALKISDFFEIVVVGSECDNPKPSPDPYLKAIKFLGVEASQCFVLEDSPSGIKAGRAAGSPVVGLLTGHPGPVLRDNGASVLIQDYHDSALWIALGEDHNACSGSQGHDSTPSTGVPPPVPAMHSPDSTPSTGVPPPALVPA